MDRQYFRLLKPMMTDLMERFGFSAFEGESDYMEPGTVTYCRKEEKVWQFICLFLDQRGYEQFTMEFGWSTKGRFPEVLPLSCPDPTDSHSEFEMDEYMQRVGGFDGADMWWKILGVEKPRRIFRPRPKVSDEEATPCVATTFGNASAFARAHLPQYFGDLASHYRS